MSTPRAGTGLPHRIFSGRGWPRRRYIVVFVVIVLLIGASSYFKRDGPFDASKWKHAGGLGCPPGQDRKRMVSDLRKHHAEPGTTMSEMRALLGKPWSIASDPRGAAFGTWWVWLTGPTPDQDCSTFNVRFVDGQAVQSKTDHT